MPTRVKVWFHRGRALVWVGVGVCSFVFGFENSVVLVWVASLYANIVSDWGAAEAADDREVIDLLQVVKQRQRGSRSHWPRRLREQAKNR